MNKTTEKKKCGRHRKPEASRRTEHFSTRFTKSEIGKLRANAAAAELTPTDYIVSRCCQQQENQVAILST